LENSYPSERFWHLIYATAEADLLDAIALSKQRNAGWIYVTDDTLPNPWNSLPDGTYWDALLDAVADVAFDAVCNPIFPGSMRPDAAYLPGVVTGTVNFREGPSVDCALIRTLEAGESVLILNGVVEVDGTKWQRISDRDGIVGWVVSAFIELEEPDTKDP